MGTCCPQSSLDKSSSAGRHTIVLVQPSPNKTSETFIDFSSLNQALDGMSECLHPRHERRFGLGITNWFSSISHEWAGPRWCVRQFNPTVEGRSLFLLQVTASCFCRPCAIPPFPQRTGLSPPAPQSVHRRHHRPFR
ncbi:hypothetical protein ACQJBY_065086 [Aegilops geniculata]